MLNLPATASLVDNLNLDGVDPETLVRFAGECAIAAPTVARRLFPDEPESQGREAVAQLGAYAAQKSDAFDARTAGRIELALERERVADTIYTVMREFAQW